jgi:hypothetical protein
MPADSALTGGPASESSEVLVCEELIGGCGVGGIVLEVPRFLEMMALELIRRRYSGKNGAYRLSTIK